MEKYVLCSINLVTNFPKAQIILYWIPQFSTLEPRASPVNNNNDVLEIVREKVVPIPTIPRVDLLRAWASVTEN